MMEPPLVGYVRGEMGRRARAAGLRAWGERRLLAGLVFDPIPVAGAGRPALRVVTSDDVWSEPA